MNRWAVAFIFFASLPAACGGGGSTPSPPASQQHPTLAASPAGIAVNLLGGAPTAFAIAINAPSGETLSGLQWSATDLSFFSASVQQTSSAAATLNVLLIGAGTSVITLRNADGASVTIPVDSAPCGRPNILTYAQLISPANGAHSIPLNTSAFYIETGGPQGEPTPFTPSMHAHIVVNNVSTIDLQSTLTPATPPPNAALPSPPPQPGSSIGYESGTMPQLSAMSSYTVYLYSDTCQAPWNAGSFST